MNDAHTLAAFDADFAALHPGLCVMQGMLVGAFRDRHALDADFQARKIHHREHVLQTAIFLPDEIANRPFSIAKRHHAGRTAMDAELVLDGNALHVVAFSEASIGIDQKFRHDEQ